MWLSKSLSLHQRTERESTAVDMGVTTIGGSSVSVMTRGEQRDLSVFSPLGLVWQPKAGDTVLVVKGGVGGQEQCIVAADTAGAAPDDLEPGELYLYSNRDTFIHLRTDGSIAVNGNVVLTGTVTVKGTLSINGNLIVNGQPYRPCTCS